MPPVEYKPGSVIYSVDEPLSHLSLITKGEVEASFGGRKFRFLEADVVGLCDIFRGSHSHTYTADSNVTMYLYPYENPDSLDGLLRSSSDMSLLMVNSMCRRVAEYMQHWSELKAEAGNAYELAQKFYQDYEQLCKKFA